MKTINVIILSGACCNPKLTDLDNKIRERITEIAKNKNLQPSIKVLAATSSMGGLGLGKEIDDAVLGLIKSRGMNVLPVVIINGKIAFYGGLASASLIEDKINEGIK